MYVVLLLLSVLYSEVEAVCFVKATSQVPFILSFVEQAESDFQCKPQCLRQTTCAGLVFSESSGKCFHVGGSQQGSFCSLPFEFWSKESNCSKTVATTDYVPDTCLSKGRVNGGICPTNAVEGEPAARLYIVSVIFPNGTHRSFANDYTLELLWDDNYTSYIVRFINGGVTLINEPIYAANCALIADDASNTCECGPFPLETQSTLSYSDVTVLDLLPSPACPAGYTARVVATKNVKIKNLPPESTFIRCSAGVWICSAQPAATNFNSYEISSGACYR